MKEFILLSIAIIPQFAIFLHVKKLKSRLDRLEQRIFLKPAKK